MRNDKVAVIMISHISRVDSNEELEWDTQQRAAKSLHVKVENKAIQNTKLHRKEVGRKKKRKRGPHRITWSKKVLHKNYSNNNNNKQGAKNYGYVFDSVFDFHWKKGEKENIKTKSGKTSYI